MADSYPMGIGIIGRPDINFKRKFRWTFQLQGFCNNIKNTVPEYFVKVAARPNLDIEEVEINHLNAKMWIPGKGTWNTIEVVYYDVANIEMQSLYNWLATVYNFTDPINLTMAEKRDYNATGVLNMYDGCGTLLESWTLQSMFPKGIDFGELDYASNEPAEIKLTLRFSDVKYKSYCPNFTPVSCCTPCGTPATASGGGVSFA